VVVEAVTRLIPGALGRSDSALQDSFSSGLLDFPHYTRPAEFRGWRVPDVLLSGDHGAVARWRREKSIERTRQRRPDLVSGASSAAPDGAAIKR
jgi:tRNA (guanine37-N1)-methyltransferase